VQPRGPSPTGAAVGVLETAIAARIFPAAVAEVGHSRGVLWREHLGTLAFDGAASTDDATVFDLASLTKPIATTTVVLRLAERGTLALDETVSACFSDWRGPDRERVTVRDLLEHASGLAARLVDRPPTTRREFEHEICVMTLEAKPRTRSIYSDLGFILLGFIAESRGGAGLNVLFAEAMGGRRDLGFLPAGVDGVAPTVPLPDDSRRGRRLAGEVHDNYAAALGGVAGHSGLFGNCSAVGRFARFMLAAAQGRIVSDMPLTPSSLSRAVARSTVPGSSRALGWDTMMPTSSCGTRMSAAAFGHVGFTGTSLWIDPTRDRYYVLLTNRVAGGGTVDQMRDVRRAFHDALADL